MPRRGDNIHKRKDGRWEGRYKSGVKENGTPKYSSVYGATFTECKQKLEKEKLLLSTQVMQQKGTNFEDILLLWFESNRIRLKGSTEMKYLNIIEQHIIPSLGKIKTSEINSVIINSFLERKLRGGGLKDEGALAPSYVKTMAIIIEATIKYATAEELCSSLKTPILKPSIPKRDLVVLSEQEEKKLTHILLCENSNVATGTLLALQTGMRIGEVCALQWSDIDFANDIIHIRHTIARIKSEHGSPKTKLIIDTPKTESSRRDIPLSDTLKKKLNFAYQDRKSKFVISNTPNFIGTRTFDYQYRKLLERNDIAIINFHSLRHTFATRCAEAGMDAKTLSRLLGHSTATVTLNIYVHPSMDKMKKQINELYCSS